MASSWFIVKPDRELGPYTSAQIKHLASSGQLKTDDLVRRADQPKTVTAGKVQGLFPQVQRPDRPRTTPPPLPSERKQSGTLASPEPFPEPTDPVQERPRTTPPPLPSERKATVTPQSSDSLLQPIDPVHERLRTMPPPLPFEKIKNGITDSSGTASSRPKLDLIRKGCNRVGAADFSRFPIVFGPDMA
jgi:hypothetical protein